MAFGVVDAGVAVGWIQGKHRSFRRIQELFDACRSEKLDLVISPVNLVEVLIHTAEASRASGVDSLALLKSWNVQVHIPDEAIARRTARLPTSLAGGFAAATALELSARLHTTDEEFIRQLRGRRISITRY